MPRDLFRDVVARPPSVRSRRTPLVVASITAHVAILLLLVVTTLVASDALPLPREAVEYLASMRATDVPPPPPPPPAPSRTPVTPTAETRSTIPTEAPIGITEEVERRLVVSEPGIGIITGASGDGVGLEPGPPPPPPPAPPPPPPPMRVSGVRAPQKVVNVAPAYPQNARLTRTQGVVIIEATIDVQGNVVDTKVLRSVPLLDDAALEAVRQWKFTPTLLNGVPVPVIMTVTVNFKLD